MTNPPAPDPHVTEEASTISDEMMVFRSLQAPADVPLAASSHVASSQAVSSSDMVKKVGTKSGKGKLKDRKSTPRPIMKGTGRKRFSFSPSPELKQSFKKSAHNDLIDERDREPRHRRNLMADLSEVAGIINIPPPPEGVICPASSTHGPVESSMMVEKDEEPNKTNQEMAIVCFTSPCEDMTLPESGVLAGGEKVDGRGKDSMLHQPWSKQEDPTNSNVVLGGEGVNLPKMDLGTKMLLESPLEPCHLDESHVSIAVGDHVVPKNDNMLFLAQGDTAEMLDGLVAQPLLAGDLPEVARIGDFAANMLLPVTNQPLLTLVANGSSPGEMANFMEIQLSPTGDRAVEGEPSDKPHPPHEPKQTPVKPVPVAAYVPPYEDFPSLERGRTLKIRNNYETGASPHGAGLGRTKNITGGQVPLKNPATGGPPRVTDGTNVDPERSNLVGDAGKGSSVENQPRAKEGPFVKDPNTSGFGLQGNIWIGSSSASAGQNLAGDVEKAKGNTTKPRTMADLLRGGSAPNGPQVFEPDKIQQIGHATLSNGIPAIHFSGAEIQKLAENIGHAIVGKFSHSIPTSHQIQKALENIKFVRSFTWKYINAKHILVQFEDMADYARLLSGPKGTPVWLIDRHPMRVFKWTPDFDAYCESPIAAIWCNLIGLPIHLFDHSALFAIGKLLGNPIQVDPETANKKRLSFARICVEIDITKPPPEEIILDICGRETVQQVRWGKIPSYCHECKHVGHTRDVCYASGKIERPEKRNYNYNKAASKQKQYGDQGAEGKQEQPSRKPTESDRITHGRNHAHGMHRSGLNIVGSEGSGEPSNPTPKGKEPKASEWSGPDITGSYCDDYGGEPRGIVGHGGGDGGKGPGFSSSLALTTVPGGSDDLSNLRGHNHARRGSFSNGRGGFPNGRGGSRGAGLHSALGGRGNSAFVNYMSPNKYYALMANGDFDVDGCGENETSEMEVQPSTEGGSDCQIIEFQGGTHTAPGTTLPC